MVIALNNKLTDFSYNFSSKIWKEANNEVHNQYGAFFVGFPLIVQMVCICSLTALTVIIGRAIFTLQCIREPK